MNAGEAAALLPQLLEARYPGEYERVEGVVEPAVMWLLRHEGAYCLLRATDTTAPFVWIKVGVGMEIPRSYELAHHVACANQQLVVGRVYLGHGEQVACVAVDETVFAESIALEFEPSVHDLVNRLETAMTHARDLGAQLLPRYGGRPFAGRDWVNLIV